MSKTTKQMIEVMEAFCNGELIQRRPKDLEYAAWALTTDPDWSWDFFDYRIKPKDEEKQDADTSAARLQSSISSVFEILSKQPGFISVKYRTKKENKPQDFSFSRPFNIKYGNDLLEYDKALFYWEFKMSDGWHKSQTRMTRDEARAFVGDGVEMAPIWSDGFRIDS
ncbi:hypothetical protein [Campylobacter sp. RM16191]|uniref:hypothetical protein n=1 Tax=Campylobacter sp. RM16191 TaxID=1705728 RepID=UPI0014737A94|nr:hypothetical protein [Campylobacter sp. RM16191]